MSRRIVARAAVAAVTTALIVGSAAGPNNVVAQTRPGLPKFEVDATFPQLAAGLVLGAVSGVAADRNGNVWIMQRPHTVPEYNAALNGYKPAPPVIEFDPKGKYLQGFGGYAPNGEYEWFYREGNLRAGYVPCPGCGTEVRGNGDHRAANGEHGIYVDQQDNVWLTGNGGRDGQILKFSKNGTFLKQIGKAIPADHVDSADTAHFARPAGLVVNARTNELYVADGYGNRRVIVFDATTGAYKRHWGAYGNVPDDKPKPTRVLTGPGNPQFNTVHGVALSSDGTVYVADRANNRIQVFTPEGKFIKEGYNQRDAKGTGSAFGVVVSPDDKWLYIADAAHEHVAIMDRLTLEVVGAFGRPGHGAGEFTNLHSIAIDPQGNLITGESQGYRVQKFLYKGLSK
jgi:DNA-binding beta-propeller fold protein YncE